MAEHDDDREVARLYRELPREEPPARLDAAIRDQARRLGALHAAPLVPPTGRRSWHFQFAAAAVLVLAVAVTWHVERELPDPVAPLAQTSPAEAPSLAKKKVEVSLPAAPEALAPQAVPSEVEAREENRSTLSIGIRGSSSVEMQARRDESAPAAAPARSAPAPAPAPSISQYSRQGAAVRGAVQESPERWLERIAQLRKDGKHDEADKALAEFRKRHSEFRIPPEMLEKVERR